MHDLGASFIVTGEVLGQRPMSQNRSALNAVDKLSGYKGYIVRPLSGRLLEATIPEKEGWICLLYTSFLYYCSHIGDMTLE